MAVSPFDQADEAWAALSEITKERGAGVLSDPVVLAGLLADMLPGAAGVIRILVTAAEDRVADVIRDRVVRGLPVQDAARLAALSFARTSMLTPDVCRWVAEAFASASGFATGPAHELLTESPDEHDKETSQETVTTVRSGPEAGRHEPTEKVVVVSAVAPATIPSASRRPDQSRRNAHLIVAFAIAIVLAAAGFGFVAWAPWARHRPPLPPVLEPTGLESSGSTFTSASFTWSEPPHGPAPGKYVIFQDGTAVGSLPGTVTVFQATGLSPGTAYVFQVMAVRGWPFNTSAILRRRGGVYVGNVTETGYLYCSTNGIKELSYLTIRIRVRGASLRNGQWDATSWSGRLSLYIPAQTCIAQGITANIHGS